MAPMKADVPSLPRPMSSPKEFSNKFEEVMVDSLPMHDISLSRVAKSSNCFLAFVVEEGKCFHGKALPQGKTASHGGACCMVIALGTKRAWKAVAEQKSLGKMQLGMKLGQIFWSG